MRVFIFGGTRGLGLALAKNYLQSGHSVAIAGRNPERVAAITAEKSPNLHYFALDISDSATVRAALNKYAAAGLDLVIVTAGLYFNDRQHVLDAASTQAMLESWLVEVEGWGNQHIYLHEPPKLPPAAIRPAIQDPLSGVAVKLRV